MWKLKNKNYESCRWMKNWYKLCLTVINCFSFRKKAWRKLVRKTEEVGDDNMLNISTPHVNLLTLYLKGKICCFHSYRRSLPSHQRPLPNVQSNEQTNECTNYNRMKVSCWTMLNPTCNIPPKFISRTAQARQSESRGKHEFTFPLVSFNDCTYIIALYG